MSDLSLQPIEIRQDVTPQNLGEFLNVADKPVVLKGLAEHWPMVKAAKSSIGELNDYLRRFYSGAPVTAYRAAPEAKGRIFYNEDFTGFNFEAGTVPFTKILDLLKEYSGQENVPTVYVGSTLLDQFFPGMRAENNLDAVTANPLVSLWVGNRSRVAAHFDFPDNLAICVSGRRRFTVFPPEQLQNLYVGPLDITPSGQAISLVDLANPDFDKYPKFKEALNNAQVAELEPGDALFLPSMWWHNVESLEDHNLLVNYWWRNTPAYLGAPINVLNLALMALKDLPERQKAAWQNMLDYYVFNDPAQHSHIPETLKGSLGKIDELQARKMRSQLLNKLNR